MFHDEARLQRDLAAGLLTEAEAAVLRDPRRFRVGGRWASPSPVALVVHTAPLAYAGDDRLDVSRYGRDPLGLAFAPSLPLLHAYKRLGRAGRADRCAWASYAAAYRDEMRASLRERPEAWDALLRRRDVTLCCYCRGGVPCHRHVLARLLAGCGATYEGER